jgi:hypothetical protein
VIYTTMIKATRGDQWDKWGARVSGSVWVYRVKKEVKMIDITTNSMKRGIQWDGSQIRVRAGPKLCFYSCGVIL